MRRCTRSSPREVGTKLEVERVIKIRNIKPHRNRALFVTEPPNAYRHGQLYLLNPQRAGNPKFHMFIGSKILRFEYEFLIPHLPLTERSHLPG